MQPHSFAKCTLAAAAVCAVIAFHSGSAAGQNFANDPFPNWAERTMHELVNRARSAPATALAGCSLCADAACYSPVAPLAWHYDLNQSARFHSAYRLMNYSSGKDTGCVLFTDIDSRYPGSSDGSFATSCADRGTTPWATRINLFATPPGSNVASAEAIGNNDPTPQQQFDYGMALNWTNGSSTCGLPSFRSDVLTNGGPALGVGAFRKGTQTAMTLDFGRNAIGSVPKIPSASHWFDTSFLRDVSTSSTTAEFWANWYDSAGPSLATVVLDDVATPMTHPADRGSLTNGSWTVAVANVSPTCHRYYFAFKDAAGAEVRYPATGIYTFGSTSCPDWQSDIHCTPPAVTSQPQNAVLILGGSTTLTVTASGDQVSYQWYQGTTGVTSTPIGSNTSSITVSPTEPTNYWVRIFGKCGTADSNAATVSIAPPAAAAALFYLVPQCRLVDTRNPNGPSGGPALQPFYRRAITVGGECGVPDDATAVSLNVTYVSSTSSVSQLTLFPIERSGQPMGLPSMLSCRAYKTCANSAVVDLSGGTIYIWTPGDSPVHFIIDVNGYFK